MSNTSAYDRSLYASLMHILQRLSEQSLSKEKEIRESFEQWFTGHAAGPTQHQLLEWDRLRQSENLLRAQIDALVVQMLALHSS